MVFFIFLLGLAIGSFLNVCIYRIPLEKSTALPSSHCTNCNTPLRWYDNIPIISFIVLQGKCRYCNDNISLRYPLVELLTGIIFVLLYYYLGLNIDFVFYAIIFSSFIVIGFIDIRYQIIPNVIILFILITTCSYRVLEFTVYNRFINLLNHLSGMAFGVIIFILIYIFSKGGIGGGDIKLIGTLGFILGIPKIILNVFLSFVIGGIISIFLLAFKIKSRKDPIPFGPFIILGFLITFFWGENIIDYYILLILA